jgi:hypothetical protein
MLSSAGERGASEKSPIQDPTTFFQDTKNVDARYSTFTKVDQQIISNTDAGTDISTA